jgi:hypothetical protein
MLNPDIQLARVNPEDATDMPTARVVWVERQGTVDQRHHIADVLAEMVKREGGSGQDTRIVAGHFQRSPGEIGTLPNVRLPIFAPIVEKQPLTAMRSQSERRPIARIARYRLFEQLESLRDLFCRRHPHLIRA